MVVNQSQTILIRTNTACRSPCSIFRGWIEISFEIDQFRAKQNKNFVEELQVDCAKVCYGRNDVG